MKPKKLTGILALLSMMLIFSVPLTANNQEPVEFQDRNLELAIRDKVGKATGNIYPSDLKGLTRLQARYTQIDSLTGISECGDLEQLYLDGNDISELSPLSGLNNLLVLWLGSNNISNLTSISGLTNLEFLRLHLNNIIDISPLSSLTSLKKLNLSYNDISDIEPLSELTNLKYLDLRSTNITSISPLSELYDLQTLRLEGNNISDIQPLIDNYKVKENGAEIGLGEGDIVKIKNNNLGLSEGSEDLQDIQTLLDRGVVVKFHPQKD